MTVRGRTKLAAITVLAAVSAIVAAALPAAPAAANLLTIAPAGSFDGVAVHYTSGDNRPTLHVTGWAADLNDGYQNGLTTAGIEFTVAAPGGARVSIGYAERGDFAHPRPDVHRAHPSVGPNQGYDFRSGDLPATGVLNLCARLYNINAAPVYTAVFGCVNVTVPASRPALASVTGGSATGSVLTAGLSAPSGGADSYQWLSWNASFGNPSGYPEPIPGAVGPKYQTALGDVGRQISALVVSRLPGVTIEQTTNAVYVDFPLPGGSTRVSSSDRFATSVAASQAAFPDSATGVPVAYVASGLAFPDALSAGAAAAKQHGTLLLTPSYGLDARVAAELIRLHPARVIVVGGQLALSDAVVTSIAALPFAPQVERIGGTTRYEVSRAIVDDAFGGSVPKLYLVTGTGFADALAAAAAGAQTGRPVLLVNGSLSKPDAATTDALKRWGTTQVTVVGGTNSISNALAGSLGVPSVRVSGADRFETAAALARTLPPTGATYIASGINFPDALSTATLAGVQHAPLLLTTGYCAPVSMLAAMRDTGVSRVVAVGGEAVLSGAGWSSAC